MINPLSLGLSGLMAAAKKTQVGSSNIANADTAGALDPRNGPKPYEALETSVTSVADGGVRAVAVTRTPGFVPSYAPDSPYADSEGMIGVPNVNLDEELVNLKAAEQAYKANAQVIRAAKDMSDELLTALDKKV